MNEPFERGFDDSDYICITGHGFNVETDTDAGMKQFSFGVPPAQKGTLIRVVHSMLLSKAPGFDMRHTLISQVETDAHVIISGHEHIGFGIIKRDDGVLFINPGALCRLSAHVAEIERPVQVALLEIESGDIRAELIPLKSAKPGHEVLSREHLEAEAERKDRIDKFMGLLAEEGESRFLEVREIVEDIAARESLPDDVKADALARLGRAREALGATGVRASGS
jgi:exonuclease SbcD